jgi:small subunit ribosomal protein S2
LSEDEESKENIEEEIEDQETTSGEVRPAEESKAEATEPSAEAVPEEELLIPRDTLLSAGIHIGTRMKTGDMEQFIYRVRADGLFVLDVKKTDDRIRVAGKFLARFEPGKIAAAAARLYAQEPVSKFCQVTGATPVIGRFIPGLLSNPLYPNRIEPELLIVSDPRADIQAVKEAASVGIPLVALCSTDNEFNGVDLVIPTNNKGRRALAVIYWLLAKQTLRERGELPMDKDLPLTIDDFEAKIAREEEET